MKVFLIDNNRVNKYMLPSKIDDTFLITYNNGNKDILITLEGKSNEFFLKSNGTVDIIDNNEVVNEIKIKLYDRYVLKVAGLPNNLEIYFMPAKESLFKLDFKNLDSFSVGSSEACHICYQEGYLTSVEAMFKSVGDEWVVSTVNDDNYKVYINNNRLTLKKLKAGDIIFLGGLKLVWMNNFICVNNPKNKLKVTGMSLIEDKESNDEEMKKPSSFVNVKFDKNGVVVYDELSPVKEETSIIEDSISNPFNSRSVKEATTKKPIVDIKLDSLSDIKKDEQAVNDTKEIESKFNFTFDANGVVTGEVPVEIPNEDDTKLKQSNFMYEFDENGIVVGIKSPMQENKEVSKSTYKFDENGKVIANDNQVKANKENYEIPHYKFDENGIIIG